MSSKHVFRINEYYSIELDLAGFINVISANTLNVPQIISFLRDFQCNLFKRPERRFQLFEEYTVHYYMFDAERLADVKAYLTNKYHISM